MARIFKRKYRAKLPDGSTVERTCKNWTVEWRDDTGKVRRRDGSADKRVATMRLGEVEGRLLRGQHDLLDPFEEHAKRPILEHVAEYVADLEAVGRDDKYTYNGDRRLRGLVAGCGWRVLKDVDANSFVAWRERARRPTADGAKRRRGQLGAALSAQTLNQYLETARAFMNWCAAKGRVPGTQVSPKRVVSPALTAVGKVMGKKARERRALSDEQVAALLAAAGDTERALVYRTALSTGLRRQELADLIRGDLRLNAIGRAGPAPFIHLRAMATKARKDARADLPASLAAALRRHLPPDGRDCDAVFPVIPDIDQWRADLAAAGIEYLDDLGRRADFHGGTRKTLCTRLHRSNVPLAVAMRKMRHTSAKLTMVDYTDDDQLELAAATLPEVEAAAPKPAEGGQTATAGA